MSTDPLVHTLQDKVVFVHMDDENDALLRSAFSNILDSVGFTQKVSGPTHCHNHTLDLVLTSGIEVDVDVFIAPHNPFLSKLF